MKCEYQWLNKIEELLEKEKLEEKEYLSRSAHFASLQTAALSPTTITSLLPLFEENAHSKAMIRHSRKLVKDAIAYINLGQTPIHIRDLLNLRERHSSVYAEFEQEKFVVQKSQHLFSKISLDQNHKQENEMIKGDGGAVGLTERPAALRRWMIAGTEIARAVKEFESAYEVQRPTEICHHEQVPSVQKAFANDVQNLIRVIEEMGNPFSEDSVDLLVLDTKEIAPKCVVEAVSGAKEKGQSMYDKYVEEGLNKRSKPVTDTIQRCNLPLFGTPEKRHSSKTSSLVTDLKSDCRLFSRLYMACQAR